MQPLGWRRQTNGQCPKSREPRREDREVAGRYEFWWIYGRTYIEPAPFPHVHLAVGPQRVAVIGRKEGRQFGLGEER